MEAHRRARVAYERAQWRSASRFLAAGFAIVGVAQIGHLPGAPSRALAVALLAVLVVAGWRGGVWRRGARAGAVAAIVTVVMPSLLLRWSGEAACHADRGQPYVAICFAVSALLGLHIGNRAKREESPLWYAAIALAIPALAGLLGCGIAGVGTAIGVAFGLGVGGVTGWALART